MISSNNSGSLPIPSAHDFLENVSSDLKLGRLHRLVEANGRLDMLRDRAEYIDMHFKERPASWYEFSQYLNACNSVATPREDAGSKYSTAFAAVTGAMMGLATASFVRNYWPKYSLSYVASALTGGSLAMAYNSWQQNKTEMLDIDRCINAYENYLDHFQQVKMDGKPGPRLQEELSKGCVEQHSESGRGR